MSERKVFHARDGRQYVVEIVNGERCFVMLQPENPTPKQQAFWTKPQKAEGVEVRPPTMPGDVRPLARATMIKEFKDAQAG